jgi:hypothetical protein
MFIKAKEIIIFPAKPQSSYNIHHTMYSRGSWFLIYNFLQFAIDGKNNSKTKVDKVVFFIFMSSYAEMSFLK